MRVEVATFVRVSINREGTLRELELRVGPAATYGYADNRVVYLQNDEYFISLDLDELNKAAELHESAIERGRY